MNRPVIIAGNWKMNGLRSETLSFFQDLGERFMGGGGKEILPAFRSGKIEAILYLPALVLEHSLTAKRQLPIRTGAQNAHWEKKGAFTGELSGPMLRELGLEDVLVAHSERRQFFGETDSTASKRAKSLLEQGFRVLFCVGETLQEREAGQTEAVLRRQIQALQGLLDGKNLRVAYEPVWAIGTGKTATPEQAQTAHLFVRSELKTLAGAEIAAQTPILYGGSANAQNADSLLSQPDVDGLLAGGASLDPSSYLSLLVSGGKKALSS